jgi:predicted metal-dependent peptidase
MPSSATTEARDKIAAARVWLIKHKPFFGVLARALRVEASGSTPAFRLLPDDRLLFAPDVVLGLPFRALCARLAHLSMHASLSAFGRRGSREARRWNVAHDLAIRPLLEAADLSVSPPLASESLRQLPHGASAEGYYAVLPAGVTPDDAWCDLCDPDLGDPDLGDPEDQLESTPPEATGQVPSVEERGRELQWTMRLAAAYEEELASGGATFGDTPEWIDEMLRASIEPPADWTASLQRAVSTLHRTARSYLRPSRRMAALIDANGRWPDTVTMPGRRVEPAGHLVTVIDTSASISNDILRRFLGAIASVATAEGIDDVRLMQADAAVTHDETLFAAELLFTEVAITGRGGTDFAPALEKLATEAKRAGESFTVIYLTDLDGAFPNSAVVEKLDVLWVTPQEPDIEPPFGRCLTMTP